jgi:hypothetical protein
MKAGHVVVRLRSGAGGRAWGPWRPVQTIARLTYRILCWYVLVCSHILHPPDAPAASLFTSRAHVTRRPQARPTSVRTSRALACLPAANSSKGPTRYIAPSSVDSPCPKETGAAPARCMTECILRMNHGGLCFQNAHQRALPQTRISGTVLDVTKEPSSVYCRSFSTRIWAWTKREITCRIVSERTRGLE